MLSEQEEEARAGTGDTVPKVRLPSSPALCSPWAMAGGQCGHSLPGGWPQPAATGL